MAIVFGARCNAGFPLPNGKTCQAKTCTYFSCTAATGYGSACQANTCTCTGGTAITWISGTFDGVGIGASCDSGFTLNGNPGQVITCLCSSGTAATGASCASADVNIGASLTLEL